MSRSTSVRRYWLPAVTFVLATLFYLLATGTIVPDEYREYRSGELVSVSSGMTATVPLGFDALWYRHGLGRCDGPGVDFKTAGRDVTGSPRPDSVRVETISTEQLAWWDKTDAHYRSIESTGVYEPRFEEFDLGDGWSAAVTTRYEARPNSEPVLIMLANLSRDAQPSVRVTAFYHEWPSDPSTAPDPGLMFARVQQHIALVLP